MLEYMSVREAAEKWGVSERRVHKLCKDGRIVGLIRFAHSWGIPRDADKPDDARKSNKSTSIATGMPAGTMTEFLGPDAKLLIESETCSVFQLENETGNGIVTVYDVFPGILLIYNDLHLSRITDHDSPAFVPDADTLVINHCREGRFECEFTWGECGYIGSGDMAVSALPTLAKNSSYPLSHYHGISIVANVLQTAKTMRGIFVMLGTSGINVEGIKERLLGRRPYYLLRNSEAVSHIFSELYNAPDELKESYIRVKLIELMLFLSIIEPSEETERKYFYKTRVQTVKAIRDYMTVHLDSQFTLNELSERFNIPLTSMKSCFKSVFGTSIHAYMRDFRLQAASAMLRDTDEGVAEIAAKVGYESHAQFSSAFKMSVGTAPSDYRKVIVQNNKSVSE